MGQSAGAAHVANYIAEPKFHRVEGSGHRRRLADLGHLMIWSKPLMTSA